MTTSDTSGLRRALMARALFLLVIFSAFDPAILPDTALRGQDPDSRRTRVVEAISPGLTVRGADPESFGLLERMAYYDVPGVSVAVMEGGEIVWAGGWGVADVDSQKPVTVHTLFQAASISKPLAAMAALKLVDQGVLELDAPVNRYLKSWTLPENEFTRDTPVTIRHLMTHTGGLTVSGFPGYPPEGPIATTLEVLDGAGPANTPPIRADTIPGSIWRYSGGGYTVLQQLLVDVTGMPFPDLMRELVLDPVGMSLSTYAQPLPSEREGEAATAHLSDGSPGSERWHVYPEMAAAGLWTNPTELARLAQDVQASLRGEAGHVLSPEMTRSQMTPGLGGYGLGFGVRGEGLSARFGHGGSNYGFKAQFLAFLEGGRGVFIMTNGDRGSSLAHEISLAVAREYGWPEPRYQEVVLVEISPGVLEEIAGSYRLDVGEMEVSVEVVEDHLRVEIPDPSGLGAPQILEIYPTAQDAFMDLTDGTQFRIERDAAGAVTAIQVLEGPRAIRVR